MVEPFVASSAGGTRALAEAERAVELDPLSAIINNSLADSRSGLGRFDDALVAYRQAIEIDPTITAPYYATGHVHGYGLGRFDAAMAWYEKAASLDPDNPDLPGSSGGCALGAR